MNPDPSALPNAVEQTAFLSSYSNILWVGFWGGVGSTINLLLCLVNKPWNTPLALATLLSGISLAMTSGGLAGYFLGVEMVKSMGITGCALFMGMAGLSVAKWATGFQVPIGMKEEPSK